jgi:putative nucleotidyltransferase with HDIG domain
MADNIKFVAQMLKLLEQASDIDSAYEKLISNIKAICEVEAAFLYWDLRSKLYASSSKTELVDSIKDLLAKRYEEKSLKNRSYKLNETMVVHYIPLLWMKKKLGVLLLVMQSEKLEERFKDIFSFLSFILYSYNSHYHLRQKKYEAINGMIAVIEALDEYTRDHSKNTANYALLLAEAMELPASQVQDIYYGALFHDVGKIGIPIEILRKQESLTDEEYEIIKQHPVKGNEILKHFADFEPIAQFVRHHHERFGGGGYPDGLKGDDIPLGARLICVVDAYDALTTNRSYRKAQGGKTAIEEIKDHTPEQFDPEIVKVFEKVEKNL